MLSKRKLLMTLSDPRNLITIDEMARRLPTILTATRIKFWLRLRNENGLKESGAIVKIERQLLIDETKFIDWLQKNKMKT